MSGRRREDRPAALPAHPDSFKLWAPTEKHYPDYDSDRRRHRSATVPSHAHDQRSQPTQDNRYHDTRQSTRTHRQDPHYATAVPLSYHQSSAPGPSTSRAYQHATRPPVQYSTSGYQYPQPSTYQPLAPTQPSYPVASSSRRPHPEAPDPRVHRRPVATPTPKSSYEKVSASEDVARTSRHPSRAVHPSTQAPPPSAPVNQSFWVPPSQEMSSARRHKDPHKDHDRDREREREREREKERERERGKEKTSAEIERDRYRERMRAERHRERERATEAEKYKEPGRSRHHDRRKESDTEGAMYPDQRNASKASLSGREGYTPSVREPVSAHRRHRTEDGSAATSARRHQTETTQNPITTVPVPSTSEPRADAMTPEQTGEPPPAPRVMPVYLPSKTKSHRSQHDRRTSLVQGAQSGSDTEWASGKHRMERTQSGAAVQRSDGYVSSSTRDRGNHDVPMGPREDVKSKSESKYGLTAQQDTRQPVPQVNVDIPLVTPGFNPSSLPSENRMGSTIPQFVSIRAGQGPSDPQAYDAHFKSPATLRSDALQETIIHPPHPTSASIVQSSGHIRSQSSEVPRTQPDRPVVVERSRTDPRGLDPPPGHRMSIHEPNRALPTPISRSQSYARGNPETGVENVFSAHPHAQPPTRHGNKISAGSVAPSGVQPPRSASQGLQTGEPPTRPPSVAYNAPVTASVPNQQFVPPSPAHRTSGGLAKTEYVPSAQPSPKEAHPHIGAQHQSLPPSHFTPIQRVPSGPRAPHPTPLVVPQTLNPSSQPSTRHNTHLQAADTHQHQAEQQLTTESSIGPRQMTSQGSSGGSMKASWVVQTAASAAKNATISREDKYLREHHLNVDPTSYGTHAQLRQVLSQDEDPFPRAASSMMKASQAMTPPTPSQRNSPGSKARDVQLSTPRGVPARASPHSAQLREVPTPERQYLPHPSPSMTGPPQIAVVGATPIAKARDLPYQGHVDHGMLVPAFPAPTRSSRTASSSRDQRPQPSQPAPRNAPSVSHQPQPPPAVHAPSMFQPYPPPHPLSPEENGQFSPPPLPIPPPRGLEDSPPPPMEIRSSEIIPARLQNHMDLEGNTNSPYQLPEDMLQKSTRLPSQASSVPPVHTQQTWQTRRLESNVAPTMTRTGSLTVPPVDVRSPRPSNMPTVQPPVHPADGAIAAAHQGATRSASAPQTQPSAPPSRPRPKVTIEDVPEDPPMFGNTMSASPIPMTPSIPTSRSTQASQQATVATSTFTKSATADQGAIRSSPLSRAKDSPLYRATESSSAPLVAPPMPPPTPAPYVPTSTYTPLSAPPTQPTHFPSADPASAQRSASQTVTSRTYQRAAEVLQTSKPSTTPVGTYPITAPNNQKPSATPIAVQTSSSAVPSTTTWQPLGNPPMSGAGAPASTTKPLASASTTTHAAAASYANKVAIAHTYGSQTATSSVPLVGALGLHHAPAPSNGSNTQLPYSVETSRQSSRPAALAATSPPDPTPATVPSSTTVKYQNQEHVVDTTRSRDAPPSATRNPSHLSHVYPISARPGTSAATSQQTHHVPPVQPPTHNRAVSLPITQPSAPPSPRKYSHPVPPTMVSTQPFPSRPPPPAPQPARVPVSGHLSTPAPPRSTRLPPPLDRATSKDSEVLKTPSSIAPSPMLNPAPTSSVPPPITVPIRTRQVSTDSKDSKKKAANFFGLFRTKSGSSKPLDPPVTSTTTRASTDNQRVHTDAPSTSAPAATSAPQRVASSSAVREPKERTPALQPAASAHAGAQPKPKGKVLDPIIIPPPQKATRERDTAPHNFTPFKFLTMHSKRNRTMSAASLDVCDGNTATNTVIGSPDHSVVQAQPLPPIIPPAVRDPLVATTEWRDREEAERRERKKNRIRRPGVTFDVEEEPPSPAPGTTSKRKKSVRRSSGRTPTPGPARS